MTTQEYSATAIQVLTGLEPVRKRPGMYTDTSRPNHLLQEVIDNSIDEALAGHADRVDIRIASNRLEVTDNGRGMPVDIHPEHGISGVELILTRLHSGGKFDSGQYGFSGGLHGVGVSVVNALSRWLEVEVRRGQRRWQQRYEAGEPVAPLADVGPGRGSGTTVAFEPDPAYFDEIRIDLPRLRHLLRAKAVLCPGLTIRFVDATGKDEVEDVWQFENGLSGYLDAVLGDAPRLPAAPFVHRLDAEAEAAEFAVSWLPEGGDAVQESYVNLIPTPQHGTHVNGLRSGLTEALREYAEIRSLLPRGIKVTADDLMDGSAFVLSAKLREPQFSGQTKERLSSRQCAAFVAGVAKDAFALFLNQHTAFGDALTEYAVERAQQRQKAARKVERKRIASGPALPGKLADCASSEAERTELFIVEGDSAGGSAKQARDREFQAVLPLRGKILNTWDVAHEGVLASNEVHDIAVALGVDPGTTDISGLRYHKICILADADSDGLHIATLLCALFLRHFPELVRAGHVHVAKPPLYRIDVGKEVWYALDDEERDAHLHRIEADRKRGKVSVQRFKGLGEMNPLQLRETTMDPDTRQLARLAIDDEAETLELMDMLLGKKRASDRRVWLETRGDEANL